MENLIVTTGAKMEPENVRLAQETARQLSSRYVERGRTALSSLREKYQAGNILIVRHGELFLDTPAGEFFFHPSMAHVRVKNLRQGQRDHFVEAAGLRRGMSLLDCTMGLGADAIVASYITGSEGCVRAIEYSPLIAAIVSFGLSHPKESGEMAAAMARIEVIEAEYGDFLRRQPDHSVDVVYFDPMFRRPVWKSAALHPLRALADDRPLGHEALHEACRVARRRVVMKEAPDSGEFARLGFSRFAGGKYSRVRYGIMEVSA